MAAMRILGYEHAGLALKETLDGVDFRQLTPKSMRILNRLARILSQYQAKYQSQAKPGITVTLSKIISAVFKGQIESYYIDTGPDDGQIEQDETNRTDMTPKS